MRTILLTFMILTSLNGFAAQTPKDVETSSQAINGSSRGPSAAAMVDFIKSIGIPAGNVAGSEIIYYISNGLVRSSSAPACGNGAENYDIEFDVTNVNQQLLKHVSLPAANNCNGPSPARILHTLLEKFGSAQLGPNCGLGSCVQTINYITCIHDTKSVNPNPDSCEVEISNNLKTTTN